MGAERAHRTDPFIGTDQKTLGRLLAMTFLGEVEQ